MGAVAFGVAALDAVVFIEGVVRLLAPMLCLVAMGILGFRVCLGFELNGQARGVVPALSVIELFRVGTGVIGTGFTDRETSDSGGDGGVESTRKASCLERGGVEAAVREERVVVVVEASEMGERGRSVSLVMWLETLR